MLLLPQGQHEEEILPMEEATRVMDNIAFYLLRWDRRRVALLFAEEKYEFPGTISFI